MNNEGFKITVKRCFYKIHRKSEENDKGGTERGD